MIIPSELDLSLAVEREAESQAASLDEQWKLRLEQAEYEARRAERRYKAVDPDNRVVARTLENEWETRLRDLAEVRQHYESAKRESHVQLSDEDRAKIRTLARDLPAVWNAPTTAAADKKAMLRIAIEAVAIRPIDVPRRLTHIDVQWRSGAVDELTAVRPSRADHNRTSSGAVERIRELATRGLGDDAIAIELNTENVKSGSKRPWTARSVKHIRLKYKITRNAHTPRGRTRLPDRHPDGRYSIRGAMKRFDVSHRQVVRWVERGLVQGVREDFGAHRSVWWLTIDGATAARLRERRTTKDQGKDAELTGGGDAS